MIDALFNQTSYQATKRLLDATVLRHEAIAANLANVETPGYRRVDVASEFTTALKQAVTARDGDQIAALRPAIALDPAAVAANRDGNTVQLENELMAMNQNSVAHALETQLVTGHMLKLRLAITGRPQ
jgi:flagellar basal-body rod protein FlgB